MYGSMWLIACQFTRRCSYPDRRLLLASLTLILWWSESEPMEILTHLKCIACRADAPPATNREIAEWQAQIPAWQIVERAGVRTLERVFKFKHFAQALIFTQRVGELAEAEGHHPDILTQ